MVACAWPGAKCEHMGEHQALRQSQVGTGGSGTRANTYGLDSSTLAQVQRQEQMSVDSLVPVWRQVCMGSPPLATLRLSGLI